MSTISYLPTNNFSGLDQLVVTVDDQDHAGAGGARTNSRSITIRVEAVNDAPVLVVPSIQRASVNPPISIRGIGATDVDAGQQFLEVRLGTTWGGTLSLARTTGLTFLQGDGLSDTAMLFRGTLADLNTSLATLDYAPSPGFTGYEVIQLSVNDLGNTGSGGPKTALRLIRVKVDATLTA
jgi:hypothetical protein